MLWGKTELEDEREGEMRKAFRRRRREGGVGLKNKSER